VTKQQAKQWACSLAADLLRSDMDGGEAYGDCVDDQDTKEFKAKAKAMAELIAELERRGGGK